MKRMPASLLAIAATVVILAASVTDAPAQWRGRGGWGWRGPGPGIAAGVVAGAVVAGAILASRPRGYVVYPGYAQPVSAPGCYWASQPVYDAWGHVVGFTGQPVQVCPSYPAPPPPGVVVGPPPGPVAGPPPGPAVGPPGPSYAAGPPLGSPGGAGAPSGDDPTAYCAQRYRSYDPKTGTYLASDGQRHPCP
jgi:hypothetical protein